MNPQSGIWIFLDKIFSLSKFLKRYFNSFLFNLIICIFLFAFALTYFLNKYYSIIYEVLFLFDAICGILFYLSSISFLAFRNIYLYENELREFFVNEGININSITIPNSNKENPFIDSEEEFTFRPAVLKIGGLIFIKSSSYRMASAHGKTSTIWIKIDFRFNEISKITYIQKDL